MNDNQDDRMDEMRRDSQNRRATDVRDGLGPMEGRRQQRPPVPRGEEERVNDRGAPPNHDRGVHADESIRMADLDEMARDQPD